MYPAMPDHKIKARQRLRDFMAVSNNVPEGPQRSPDTGQHTPIAGPNDTAGQAEVQTAPASEAYNRLVEAMAHGPQAA